MVSCRPFFIVIYVLGNASLARSEKHRRIKIAKTEEHALLFHIFHSQKERRDFGGQILLKCNTAN